jgi:23S rRNA G2445 N2-methylase RlmL
MVSLTRPKPDDVFLNIACGSGTILIERLACMSAARILGCDYSQHALECAAANIAASHGEDAMDLLQCDARSLPLPSGSVDAVCVDLPFGQRTGSHEENVALYPRLIEETGRVAKRGARFAVITHEIRLMDSVLSRTPTWQTENSFKITLRGLHPRIYVLTKV